MTAEDSQVVSFPICKQASRQQDASSVWLLRHSIHSEPLCTVLMSLILLLAVAGGCARVQETPPVTQAAPPVTQAAPPVTQAAEPVPVPTGPLPSPQERLLAPVPQQFNWLAREVPSNALLESLLSLQKPGNLIVSVSLTQEASDNFDHSPSSHRIDTRTGVVLGTVYRLADARTFVSLANTVQAFYEETTGSSQIGFANLALNAGYELPPWSFGLSDSFVRGDNTVPDATVPFLRTRRKFIRNVVSPQVRYDITPSTAATLSYTNELVVDEDSNQGTTTSHTVTSAIQHQFSRNLSGTTQYTFRTSDGTELATLVPIENGSIFATPIANETSNQGTTTSHTVTSAIQYQLSRNLSGATQYTFRTSEGAASSGGRSHSITTNLGYNYDIDRVTSATFGVFGTLIEQSESAGRLSRIYGASIGARRLLFSTATLFVSVGPTVFKRQGEPERFRASWNVSLDGPITLFATPSLILTLTTRQSVDDTFGEVNDVGLVLRQMVAARLTYTPSASFVAALFAEYSRNELLENVQTVGSVSGRREMIWNTGVTASYALTRLISLTAIYRYQRRDSDFPRNDFDENRVTIAVTGTFPIF